jgi:hypothetical protein
MHDTERKLSTHKMCKSVFIRRKEKPMDADDLEEYLKEDYGSAPTRKAILRAMERLYKANYIRRIQIGVYVSTLNTEDLCKPK